MWTPSIWTVRCSSSGLIVPAYQQGLARLLLQKQNPHHPPRPRLARPLRIRALRVRPHRYARTFRASRPIQCRPYPRPAAHQLRPPNPRDRHSGHPRFQRRRPFPPTPRSAPPTPPRSHDALYRRICSGPWCDMQPRASLESYSPKKSKTPFIRALAEPSGTPLLRSERLRRGFLECRSGWRIIGVREVRSLNHQDIYPALHRVDPGLGSIRRAVAEGSG